MAEILGKSKLDPGALSQPLPADYPTFTRMYLQREKEGKEGGRKKGLGFGVGSRMPLTENEKWLAKVPIYNSHAEKALDPKKDALPGPNAYSLIAHWPGKKSRKALKGEENGQKLPNVLSKISKGPVINLYYRRID